MKSIFASLQSHVQGTVVLSDDKRYDELRQTKFNHSAKPAVIVECTSEDDVVAAVAFARDNHLKLSVRSGGHSGAGLSTNDNGLVIDVSPMNQVEVMGGQDHIVRLGAGAKWGEVAEALKPHNLAISSGDTNSVGVGGLSLGGGIGWMVRKHGLSIDNLEAVELVTADGEKVRATAKENTDLFWAVRGGGGNFGVATAFEFRAEPCTGIVGGKLVFDAADRKLVLEKWAEYMRTAPEELNSTVVLFPGFGPGTKPQVVIMMCYADHDQAAAERAIQPFREIAPLVSDDVKLEPYADMLEDMMDMPNQKVRVRNGFVRTVTPELIDALADNFGKPRTPPIQIRSLGGAMSRVPADATAFEHRDVEALIVVPTFSAAETPEEQANQQADNLWAPLKPFTHGAYCGFQTDNSEHSTKEAYEINLKRLGQIKEMYDPKNLFDQNTNIQPVM